MLAKDKFPAFKIIFRYAWVKLFCLFLTFYMAAYLITTSAQETGMYNLGEKRDPFIPLVTSDGRLLSLKEKEAVGGLSLEGIIYDEHGLSYAIVNGRVVKIGDGIGDYRVLKVEKNKVIFVKEGQAMEVELKKEE